MKSPQSFASPLLTFPPTSAPRVQRGKPADASNRTSTGRAGVSPRPPALSSSVGQGCRSAVTKGQRSSACPTTEPELAMQECSGRLNLAFAWLAFHAVVIWAGAHAWLTLKRQCAWCQCRLGGNPLSRNVTHGICPSCRKSFLDDAGIES